jgi:hypothetical protein
VKTQDPLAAALATVLAPIVRAAVADAIAEMAPTEPRPELLTVEDICRELQVSRATLHKLRGEGLPTLTVGDSPRFRIAEVLAWLREKKDET